MYLRHYLFSFPVTVAIEEERSNHISTPLLLRVRQSVVRTGSSLLPTCFCRLLLMMQCILWTINFYITSTLLFLSIHADIDQRHTIRIHRNIHSFITDIFNLRSFVLLHVILYLHCIVTFPRFPTHCAVNSLVAMDVSNVKKICAEQ